MGYIKKLIVTIIACAFFLNAGAQFYNGHQMTFGKNRVQYFNYYWSFYRFDDFDCYFNEYGKDLAEFTADYATKKLEEIEKDKENIDRTLASEKNKVQKIIDTFNEKLASQQ